MPSSSDLPSGSELASDMLYNVPGLEYQKMRWNLYRQDRKIARLEDELQDTYEALAQNRLEVDALELWIRERECAVVTPEPTTNQEPVAAGVDSP